MINIIIIIILARIIEAYRDAEIFKNPTANRSWQWHILKFPQYGFWLLAGYFLYKHQIEYKILFLTISIILAYFAFEFFLKFFRKEKT